jgi:hypothetical protein
VRIRLEIALIAAGLFAVIADPHRCASSRHAGLGFARPPPLANHNYCRGE